MARYCGPHPESPRIDATCRTLERLAEEWGPEADADSLAKRSRSESMERSLRVRAVRPHRRDPLKSELNEDPKLLALSAELPEADHDEIVGWQRRHALQLHGAVFLEDADHQHPRVRERIDLTAELIEAHARGG